MTPEDIVARRRFTILSLVRLSGAALLLLGLISVAGKNAIPQAAGIVLVVAGLANFLYFPRQLARKWKTPRP